MKVIGRDEVHIGQARGVRGAQIAALILKDVLLFAAAVYRSAIHGGDCLYARNGGYGIDDAFLHGRDAVAAVTGGNEIEVGNDGVSRFKAEVGVEGAHEPTNRDQG